MSDRVILRGEYRLVITDPLKKLLHQRVQRRYPDATSQDNRTAVLKELLGHSYLLNDAWSAADYRYRVERANRCRSLLGGFQVRLERGEIRYQGLGGATGQPELTPAQLKDHSLRLLDISPEWLILSLCRHPQGGADTVRRQYWLYSRAQRVLHLLHAETVAVIKDGRWMVQSGGMPWRDPDETLERDFFALVVRHLGPQVLDSVRQSSAPGDLLANVPDELLTQCQSLSGIDYSAEEASRRTQREREYLKRYGPRAVQPLSLSTSGIELIYADEERPSQE